MVQIHCWSPSIVSKSSIEPAMTSSRTKDLHHLQVLTPFSHDVYRLSLQYSFYFHCLCCIILCRYQYVEYSFRFYPTLSPILWFKSLTIPLSYTSALSSFKAYLLSFLRFVPATLRFNMLLQCWLFQPCGFRLKLNEFIFYFDLLKLFWHNFWLKTNKHIGGCDLRQFSGISL